MDVKHSVVAEDKRCNGDSEVLIISSTYPEVCQARSNLNQEKVEDENVSLPESDIGVATIGTCDRGEVCGSKLQNVNTHTVESNLEDTTNGIRKEIPINNNQATLGKTQEVELCDSGSQPCTTAVTVICTNQTSTTSPGPVDSYQNGDVANTSNCEMERFNMASTNLANDAGTFLEGAVAKAKGSAGNVQRFVDNTTNTSVAVAEKFVQVESDFIRGYDLVSSKLHPLVARVLAFSLYPATDFTDDPTVFPVKDLHAYCLCCYDFETKPYSQLSWPITHPVNMELVFDFCAAFVQYMHEGTMPIPRATGTPGEMAFSQHRAVIPTHVGHGRCWCCYDLPKAHLEALLWPPQPTHVEMKNGVRMPSPVIPVQPGTHLDISNDSDSNSSNYASTSSSIRFDSVLPANSSTNTATPTPVSSNSKIVLANASSGNVTTGASDFTESQKVNTPLLRRAFGSLVGSSSSEDIPRDFQVSQQKKSKNVEKMSSVRATDSSAFKRKKHYRAGKKRTSQRTSVGQALVHPTDSRGMAVFTPLVTPVEPVMPTLSLSRKRKPKKPSYAQETKQQTQEFNVHVATLDQSETGNGVKITACSVNKLTKNFPETPSGNPEVKRAKYGTTVDSIRYNDNGSVADVLCDMCGVCYVSGSTFKRHFLFAHVKGADRDKFCIKKPTDRTSPYVCFVGDCYATSKCSEERKFHLQSSHDCITSVKAYNVEQAAQETVQLHSQGSSTMSRSRGKK